jgi:hypothetical protein
MLVNLSLSSFEKIFVIPEGNIDINPDALYGSAFLNKNFDTKDSPILAALEDSPLLCENSPNISSNMLYYRQ